MEEIKRTLRACPEHLKFRIVHEGYHVAKPWRNPVRSLFSRRILGYPEEIEKGKCCLAVGIRRTLASTSNDLVDEEH